jgi:predicted phosphohydrolase
MSLDAARACEGAAHKETLVFMHFPPVWNGREVASFLDVLCEYGIKRCYYGHIHGSYTVPASVFWRGTEFSLVSADYLDFTPRIILPNF